MSLIMNNKTFIEEDIVDEPLEEAAKNIKSLENAVNIENNFNAKADYADRMDKHLYKKYGLRLMIGCGIAYILIVISDTLLGCFGKEISTLSTGLIELLKFVISTLIGFVFAEIPKNDKQ